MAYRYTLWILLKSHWFGTCGWRGTVAEMGARMVEAMQMEFGSNPNDILAPLVSIGQCCYEVDAPVYEKVMALTGDCT
ncbi:MAG: laccase domain-containing protein [Acutalibacteraceae bacterium]